MPASVVTILANWARISEFNNDVSTTHMRRMRQRAATISSTRSSSAGPAGWYLAKKSLNKRSNSSGSSVSRIIILTEVRPCFKALRDDLARPSGDTGPRDLAPLILEISDLRFDDMFTLLARVYSRGPRLFSFCLIDLNCFLWFTGLPEVVTDSVTRPEKM